MAQLGRALRSGRRGRVFESRHSDLTPILWGFLLFIRVKKLVGFGWDYPVCAKYWNLALRSWIIFFYQGVRCYECIILSVSKIGATTYRAVNQCD